MAYGLSIARGLIVTFKHIFKPPITVNFPEETRQVPVRARTNLLWFEERCTGCSTCAQACPDGCILVQTSPREDGTLNIDRYEIDFRICMYCGLCEEACPEEAIVMSDRIEISSFSRAGTLWNKQDLLVPSDQLARRLEYIRRGYNR